MRSMLMRIAVTALLGMSVSGIQAADTGIPDHPSDLKFKPRTYTPPKASDYKRQLSNGATAFLVEDHDFPLVTVSVLVRTGKYLEPAEKAGLASLTGSQMRSGGTKSKPAAQFDEEVAFLAARITSGIGDTSGSASVNCLTKDMDACLDLFVDMLRNPAFDEGRLHLAKNQILQGLERRNDDTGGIEGREWARLIRGDKFFTTNPVTKASIESITRDDLIAFHDRYYYPANFVFAVSGDFKTPEMVAKLEKAFAGWPSKKMAVPPVPKPDHTPQPGYYMVNKPDVNQGRVLMGHLGVMISNPDHLALGLMNGILGGDAFTSRIMSRVRSDEGLAYSAGSFFHAGTYYPGTFAAEFQSKSPTVAQATALVKEEIEKMRTTKVTAEELETARAAAIETLPLQFATASQKASQFAQDFYTNLPEDYWSKYTDRLKAVTVDEIQRVAQKYLHPDQMAILLVGNAAAIQKGNPDKPEYSVEKMAGPKGITMIPLPDPLTMVYPKQ